MQLHSTAKRSGTIVGKGVINNKMSNYIMKQLEAAGVPTHLVEELSDRETAVKKRFYRTAGSHCKKRSSRQFFQENGR